MTKFIGLILINFFILSCSAQSLEKEFLAYTKDEKTLRHIANFESLDSLLTVKNVSHPSATVGLIKKMMYNGVYCDMYRTKTCLSLKEDEVFDCLLCQDQTDREDLRLKYPNIFKDEKYSDKISRFYATKR